MWYSLNCYNCNQWFQSPSFGRQSSFLRKVSILESDRLKQDPFSSLHGDKLQGVNLTAYLHLVPSTEMVSLHLHSSIRLHGLLLK
jgi:hypothetical protein